MRDNIEAFNEEFSMPMNGWFWTTDPVSEALTQQLGGAEGWQEVAICCKLLAEPMSNTAPLIRYRFTSGTDEISHYWTTNWSSEAISSDNRWIQEGTIGHVFTEEQPDTVPLMRFEGAGGLKYWTIDSTDTRGLTLELESIGWVYPLNHQSANLNTLRRFERQRVPHCIQYTRSGETFFLTIHVVPNLDLIAVGRTAIQQIAQSEGRPIQDYTVVSTTEGSC